MGERSTYQPNLSEERRQRLDRLGFVWDVLASAWEEGFGHLKTYKEREGHCRVPLSRKENGFPLGQWVNVQRANKDISEERRQRLGKLGFVWDPSAADWEKGFLHLKAYKEREGHCRVPARYRETGFWLGAWVDRQRQNKDRLSETQRQQLEKLGFVWNVRAEKRGS
jgi:Helicase associated domain